MTPKQRKRQQRKELRLRRKLAALNGHKGFAFDLPKEDLEHYNRLKPWQRCLTQAEFFVRCMVGTLDLLRQFRVLIHTDQGVYRSGKVTEILRELTPGSEKVKITITFGEALQKVTVYSLKILNSDGECVISKELQVTLKPNDTLNIPYTIYI